MDLLNLGECFVGRIITDQYSIKVVHVIPVETLLHSVVWSVWKDCMSLSKMVVSCILFALINNDGTRKPPLE